RVRWSWTCAPSARRMLAACTKLRVYSTQCRSSALVLVDATTDLAFLRETMGSSWRSLSASSPNLRAPQPRLLLLEVMESESAAVDMIEAMSGSLSEGREATIRES